MPTRESEQFSREAQEHERRSQLNERLEELMKSGIRMEEIADILDAEDFLYNQEVRSKRHGEVTGFDAERYIDTQIAKEAKLRLPQKVIKTTKTILPPGEGEVITGSGEGMEKKEYIPRTRYFMELMEEMDLEYTLIEGENNEEGNATYIVESEDPEGEWEQYADMTKEKLREMRKNVGGVGLVEWEGKIERWKASVKKFIEIRKIKKQKEKKLLTSVIKKEEKVHTEPEQEENNINESQKEISGSEWIPIIELIDELDASRTVIDNRVDRYKKDKPEWVMRRKNRQIYITPGLAKIIKEEIIQQGEKPPGFLGITEISNETGATYKQVKVAAGKYKKNHPEWFKKVRTGSHLAMHYAPELMKIIRDEIERKKVLREQKEKDKSNWITINRLRSDLDVGYNVVQWRVDKYRETNPEWFVKLPLKGGQMRTHISPELAELIKMEIISQREEYEGWLTRRKINEEYGISYDDINEMVDKYKSSNPEWLKELVTGGGPAEHISPELIKIIVEKYPPKQRSKRKKTNIEVESLDPKEEVPNGWIVKNELAKKLGTRSYGVIDNLVQDVQDKEKEIRTINKYTYYSPEIVDKAVDKYYKIPRASEGWRTRRSIADELGVQEITIKRMIDKYREDQREWFKMGRMQKRSHVHEHLSPELQKIIFDEFKGREYAKPDWLTLSGLAKELGIKPAQIKRNASRVIEEHPELIKKAYHSKRNVERDFILPELQQMIRDELKMKGII